MADQDKKSKLLIVDDDPMNILILEEMLGDRYEYRVASSEDEATHVCEEFKPDLILLDIMMQNSNGYEVCRKLKSHEKLKLTKIILISSKALLKDRLFGYEAGADDYLSKPFDRDELLAKIGIFIRLKSVEEIDKVKDDLINIFSHETRTPLNAIIGFAKLMKETSSLNDEEKEYVDLILESGLSLLSLSNKAILLSNLKKGTMELSPSETEAHEMLDNAMRDVPQSLLHKKIKVENTLKDIVMDVDEKLITTALTYLLDNAHRFSPKETKITVSSDLDPASGGLRINVMDSGPGIPKGRLSTLFDAFGVQDVAHHGRGHGLSLAIVKHIMQLHKGNVSVRNNADGPGCIISLIFPENSFRKV
jgi:signal transduction histidine kinase